MTGSRRVAGALLRLVAALVLLPVLLLVAVLLALYGDGDEEDGPDDGGWGDPDEVSPRPSGGDACGQPVGDVGLTARHCVRERAERSPHLSGPDAGGPDTIDPDRLERAFPGWSQLVEPAMGRVW